MSSWPPLNHQDVQDKIDNIAFPDYFRSGYYSLGMFPATNGAGLFIGANLAYVRPFLVLATHTFDRIGINVSTAASAGSGGLVQLALFGSGALPGAKLFESSTVSAETTGAKEWTINQTLTPGVWWVGVRAVVASFSAPGTNTTSSVNHMFVQYETVPATSASIPGSFSYSVVSGTPGFPSSGASPTGVSIAVPFIGLRAA